MVHFSLAELNDWNVVVSVTSMAGMFSQASNFFNQPLNDWNMASMTNMEEMFEEAFNFN